MLGDKNVMADIAVKDLQAAKDFYVGKLGLKLNKENEYEVLLNSGTTLVHVYKSEFAGTNKATTCTFISDNVEGDVDELKAMGIKFEHYELPGVTMMGDVHVMGDEKAAWFKDPDGNTLCVGSPNF
ncbi:MAG TPA: VOC family protein [Candidatus Saccharimonadales bacterium]|nr:VOC family protein [Candidatus Saccharimonadales bacterium]